MQWKRSLDVSARVLFCFLLQSILIVDFRLQVYITQRVGQPELWRLVCDVRGVSLVEVMPHVIFYTWFTSCTLTSLLKPVKDPQQSWAHVQKNTVPVEEFSMCTLKIDNISYHRLFRQGLETSHVSHTFYGKRLCPVNIIMDITFWVWRENVLKLVLVNSVSSRVSNILNPIHER